jgi:hypothetical protein
MLFLMQFLKNGDYAIVFIEKVLFVSSSMGENKTDRNCLSKRVRFR